MFDSGLLLLIGLPLLAHHIFKKDILLVHQVNSQHFDRGLSEPQWKFLYPSTSFGGSNVPRILVVVEFICNGTSILHLDKTSVRTLGKVFEHIFQMRFSTMDNFDIDMCLILQQEGRVVWNNPLVTEVEILFSVTTIDLDFSSIF